MSKISLELARDLDNKDPLKSFRERFYKADPRKIYLDGNSLGRLPVRTREIMERVVVNEWGEDLIESWNKRWYSLSEHLGNKLGGILGADHGEIIFADSTSVNLYKLMVAALNYQGNRNEVVSDEMNFPSDLYLLQGMTEVLKHSPRMKLIKSHDDMTISKVDIERSLSDSTAVVMLSHVSFKSSFAYDMEEVTQLAHEAGALVIWDLSHSAGVLPIDLAKSGVDMAVGCSYKYLNGGPGAPAFMYVRKDLQPNLFSPITGWFGADKPFDFELNYTPSSSLRRFLTGTPPVLSLSAIEPGIDIILEAGIQRIRRKSIRQTDFLMDLINEYLVPLGFSLGSPKDSTIRGSHISIRHKNARIICDALIHDNPSGFTVIPDFREPDYIRLGVSPLYISFEDLFHAVKSMEFIVKNGHFGSTFNKKGPVT